MQTRDLTQILVESAINESADDVLEYLVDECDETMRDAINLVVNATLHRLFTDPDADIPEVISACYDESPFGE